MLIPFILRFCAAEALRGNTYAEERVYDSSVDTLDEFLKDASSPFIVISTDEAEISPDVHDVGKIDKVDLVLDIGVGSAMTADDGAVTFVIPHTDAGAELAVNLLTRQVLRHLFEPNSGGDFGKIFRKVGIKCTKISIRRGAGAENGVRFSAAQLIVSMTTLQEPAFGRIASNVFSEFIALVRAHPKHGPIADAIEQAFIGDIAVPDWKAAASALGLSDETGDAIGILPLGLAGDVDASQATVSPDGWVITEADIADQLPEVPS